MTQFLQCAQRLNIIFDNQKVLQEFVEKKILDDVRVNRYCMKNEIYIYIISQKYISIEYYISLISCLYNIYIIYKYDIELIQYLYMYF